MPTKVPCPMPDQSSAEYPSPEMIGHSVNITYTNTIGNTKAQHHKVVLMRRS